VRVLPSYAADSASDAEIKFRQEYDKIERAKGTQGTFAGRDVSGGLKFIPPEKSEPTIKELQLDKNRLARAKKLKELSALS
jgi:hypothetical protein